MRGCQHRDVIDPKYDSCTKARPAVPTQKNLAADIRKAMSGKCVLKSTHRN
jgi:hypothetical protein